MDSELKGLHFKRIKKGSSWIGFCAMAPQNDPPIFWGGRGPLPSGENSPLNFFLFCWIETRWINKSAKFGPARCNPWGATGPPKFANVWPFGENILNPAGSLI